MAIRIVHRLEPVKVDGEQRRTGGISPPHDALDAVREVEATSESCQHVRIHDGDEVLRPDQHSIGPGGEHLRDEQPDRERQDGFDSPPRAVQGRSIAAHAGPATKTNRGPDATALRESDEDEHQREECPRTRPPRQLGRGGQRQLACDQEEGEAEQPSTPEAPARESEQAAVGCHGETDDDSRPGTGMCPSEKTIATTTKKQ